LRHAVQKQWVAVVSRLRRDLILRAERVHVEDDETHGFTVRAEFVGEPIDPARHALGADVKAATLYGLRVEPRPDGWEAEVTLDV
jgi:SHS2 domain-containing protein